MIIAWMGLLSCNLGGRGQLNIIFKLFMSIIKIKSLEEYTAEFKKTLITIIHYACKIFGQMCYELFFTNRH